MLRCALVHRAEVESGFAIRGLGKTRCRKVHATGLDRRHDLEEPVGDFELQLDTEEGREALGEIVLGAFRAAPAEVVGRGARTRNDAQLARGEHFLEHRRWRGACPQGQPSSRIPLRWPPGSPTALSASCESFSTEYHPPATVRL